MCSGGAAQSGGLDESGSDFVPAVLSKTVNHFISTQYCFNQVAFYNIRKKKEVLHHLLTFLTGLGNLPAQLKMTCVSVNNV